MNKSETILEKMAHEILCDFEIKKHHSIPATRQDLLVINK